MSKENEVYNVIREYALSPEGRLRHWVATLLHWSVDDPRFVDFNAATWVWYSCQREQDHKEEMEKLRDVAEYIAMFSNADGVRKVQHARAQAETNVSAGRDISALQGTLKKFFGREVDATQLKDDKDSIESSDKVSDGDTVQVIRHDKGSK